MDYASIFTRMGLSRLKRPLDHRASPLLPSQPCFLARPSSNGRSRSGKEGGYSRFRGAGGGRGNGQLNANNGDGDPNQRMDDNAA